MRNWPVYRIVPFKCVTEISFNMKRILITYGTDALAQRIGKMLAGQFEVLYASSQPFPDVLLKQQYRKLPTAANPTFVHEVLKLALDESIDYILPLGKEELPALQEARILFEEYGQSLLMPLDLDNTLILQHPDKHMPIRLISAGADLLTQAQLTESDFSGAAVVSDSGAEVVLCLI